jgi:K+-sensing histidine kinase KdpD
VSDIVHSPADIRTGSPDLKISWSERRRYFFVEHGIPVLIGLGTVAVITSIMMMFSQFFVSDHLIFVYLLPIAGIAMYFSSTPAVVTMIVSVFGTAYFLFPPVFSFRIDDS